MTSTPQKIYLAGHRGMVGSAIMQEVKSVIASPSIGSGKAKARQSMHPCTLVARTHTQLDLTNPAAVQAFFEKEKPTQAVHNQRVDPNYQYAHEH
jgi:GDP-L-fucose synthase